MVKWSEEDAQKIHAVVMALDAEAQRDVMNSGAYLLASESAVNILTPLKQMRRLAARLREVLNSGSHRARGRSRAGGS